MFIKYILYMNLNNLVVIFVY